MTLGKEKKTKREKDGEKKGGDSTIYILKALYV